MAEIFISYSRKDRQRARLFAEALIRRGYSVWWDVNLLPGDDFSKEISFVIHSSKAVVVLWSKNAVDSRFVRDEALLASRLGKLIPVLIEPIVPPLGFQSYHYADLSDWTGDPDALALRQLFEGIRAKVPQPSSPAVNSTLAVQNALDTFKEEATYWVSISGATPQRVEEYEAYLARFGDKAVFADLAYSRMKNLGTVGTKPSSTQRWFDVAHFGDRANVWLSIIAAVVTIAGSVAWPYIWAWLHMGVAPKKVIESPSPGGIVQPPNATATAPDTKGQGVAPSNRQNPSTSQTQTPADQTPADTGKSDVATAPPVSKTVKTVQCGPFRDGDNVATKECVSAGGGDWKVLVRKTTRDALSPIYTITGNIDQQYCGSARLDGTSDDGNIECKAPPNGEGRLELVVRPSVPAGFDAYHVPITISVTRTRPH